MNIKNILFFYTKKYGLDIDDGMIDAFAEYLGEATHTRPIPDFKDVIASKKIDVVFKALLEKLHAARKSLQEKYILLNQITAETLIHLTTEGFEKAKSFLQKNSEFLALIGFQDLTKLNRCMNPEELRDYLDNIKERILSINYNNIFDITAQNDLTRCALEIHSEICKQSLEPNNGPAKFIHFYEQLTSASKDFRGNPRASEYLYAYDSEDESAARIDFNKTSHGIGSGIYGVANLSAEIIKEQVEKRHSQFCIIETKFPLRLSQEEADKYTEISKALQEIGNLVKAEQTQAWLKVIKLSRKEALDLIVEKNKTRLMEFAITINSFESIKSKELTNEEIYTILYSSMKRFLEEARSNGNAESIVPMPINFLVGMLGFTGVVGQSNDRFNRGLIAMDFSDNSELQHLAIIPVKSLDQDEHSSPNAEESEDELTSDTPFPTKISIGGPNLFFTKQQASAVADVTGQRNNPSIMDPI